MKKYQLILIASLLLSGCAKVEDPIPQVTYDYISVDHELGVEYIEFSHNTATGLNRDILQLPSLVVCCFWFFLLILPILSFISNWDSLR